MEAITIPETDEEIADLVRETRNQCWNEFHASATRRCQEIISTLGQRPPPRAFDYIDELLQEAERQLDEEGGCSYDDEPTREPDEIIQDAVVTWTFGDDGSEPIRTVESEKVYTYKAGTPCPPYTSCVPTSTSLWSPDETLAVLPFFPYSDDPDFDREDFLSRADYDSFAWEGADVDPDRKQCHAF